VNAKPLATGPDDGQGELRDSDVLRPLQPEGLSAAAVLWSPHLFYMKTLSALLLCSGLLLASAAFGQLGRTIPEWQSVAIVQTCTPVFPYLLTQTGVTRGQAQVAVSTDDKGNLVEWLVVAYSHPALAREAVDSIKQWKFLPARLRGDPVGTTIDIFFDFEAKGVVVSTTTLDLVARATIFASSRDAYQPCSLRELDRIPTPLTTIAPQYPAKLAKKGVRGKVTVDFYIDETGTARMPSVASHDNIELTALSIEALRRWKFEPPTRDGNPVLVRAAQVFTFDPEK
jgi:TonB family protein